MNAKVLLVFACYKFVSLLLLYFTGGQLSQNSFKFVFRRYFFFFLAVLSILLCVNLCFLLLASTVSLSVLFQFRLIPRTKKAPATILVYFRCALLLRSRISLRFSVSRPDDNSRANDDDKLQLDALMRRKCPPAGKYPGVESCRALIRGPVLVR